VRVVEVHLGLRIGHPVGHRPDLDQGAGRLWLHRGRVHEDPKECRWPEDRDLGGHRWHLDRVEDLSGQARGLAMAGVGSRGNLGTCSGLLRARLALCRDVRDRPEVTGHDSFSLLGEGPDEHQEAAVARGVRRDGPPVDPVHGRSDHLDEVNCLEGFYPYRHPEEGGSACRHPAL
jgi:hypothetical protein